ncbi:probable E3 ubiquitin-protein ligase makorin-3 [Octodon degus]|uniref:RING-type E3 ubiquitin transferase n=1 Tax=Octodon degus TaxID=10160 RepID=A0A6P3FK62_OCTDE|nr:probable E3 ubiquitin-protein ligase makorin-3 [Octodon degus]
MEDPAALSQAHGGAGAKAGAEGDGEVVSQPSLPRSEASGVSEVISSASLHVEEGWATLPMAVSPVQPLTSGSRPAQASGGGARPNPLQERSSGSWTKQILCRYYLHGQCKEGENCCYSHDLARQQRARESQGLHPQASSERVRSVAVQSEPPTEEELEAPPAASSSSFPLFGLAAENNFFEAEVDHSGFEAAGGEAGMEGWVSAFEFAPALPYQGFMVYAQAFPAPLLTPVIASEQIPVRMWVPLCRYAANGNCIYGERCMYLHGDVCDMCGLQALHPVDADQREAHIRACIAAHERDMELSFAVQRSVDKVCGICMEVVYEKNQPAQRRFGILYGCKHTYCLSCIRTWRSGTQFENRISKSCPQCRVSSSFVIPSVYWVEGEEEKEQLIQEYKESLRHKPCMYFAEGRGHCPFGDNCFYKHEYPHDQKVHYPRSGGDESSGYWHQILEPVCVEESNRLFESSNGELFTLRMAKVLFKKFLALRNGIPFSDDQ